MGEEEIDMVDEKELQAEEAGAYELDLNAADDAEEAMRSALDAVEQKKRRRQTIPVEGPADVAEGDGDSAEEAAAGEKSSESGGGAQDEEAAALKQRLLRTLADFDNYRKRTDREKETLKKYAVSEVIKDLLGVVDNLERATAASGTIEELKKGLEMVLRQQSEVMKRFGVEPVAAVDMPFDPTLHEAVAREDSADVTVPTVIGELQRGYTIHDRLLRPAMVHVAMPTAAAKPTAEASSETERDETGDSE